MSEHEIKCEKRNIVMLILLGIIWLSFSLHNSIVVSHETDKLNIIIQNQEKIISYQPQVFTNNVN